MSSSLVMKQKPNTASIHEEKFIFPYSAGSFAATRSARRIVSGGGEGEVEMRREGRRCGSAPMMGMM